MKDLLAAMALREQVKQAAEQRTSAPSLARRPPTALPGLSPRGAELLRAIVGARSSAATRPPDTAVPTTAGSGLGGPLMGGSPNLIGKAGPVSRADLIAQQTGGDVPPPEPMPTPTPTQTAVPNYESSPVLRKRGVEGRPDLQTRQYAAPFRSSIGQPGTPSYRQNQLDEITSYIEAGDYAYPPPGSMIEMEEWGGYEIDEKVAIAEGIRQQIESAPAVVPENLEAFQEEALAREPTVDVGGTVGEGTQWLGSNVRDVLDDPASWAFENLIVKPKKSWDEANAEVMYYMATHDGEMPTWAEIFYGDAARLPDLGIQRIDEDRQIITAYEPGTINTVEIPYVSISDTEVVTADGQVLQRDATGNIIGYRPPQPFTQPTLEDVKGQMTGQETIGQDKTNQVFGPVWLADNPELQPIVAKIYEDAEAARAANPDADLPTGSEALSAWFKTNQTLLGRVIDEVVNDPLNVLFITKILGSGVRSAADAAYIAEHPNLAKLLNASGIVIQLPNTVLNEGPEALFRGAGWLGRKAGPLAPSESAVRETIGEEIVQSGRLTTDEMFDPEAAFRQNKDEAAAAAQAKRDAADLRARQDAEAAWRYQKAQARERERLITEKDEARRAEAEKRAAARAEAQAEKEAKAQIDADIKAARQRAADLAEERAKAAQYRNRAQRMLDNAKTKQAKADAAAARTQARIDEAAAKKAEREAKTELDRLIKQAAAREQAAKAAEMPATIPLEAAPTRMTDEPVRTGEMLTPYTRQLRPADEPIGDAQVTFRDRNPRVEQPELTPASSTDVVPEPPAGPVTPPPASGRVITQDLGWMSPGTTSKGTPNLTARLLDEPNAPSFFREMEDRIASHVRQVDELQGLRATNERFARPAEALERVRFQNEMREAMQFYFPDNPSLWDTAFPFDARKGTEQWAIERAAFGTMVEASEGFWMLRNFERSGGRVVDQGVVDEIRGIRQARFGDADIVDPPAQAVDELDEQIMTGPSPARMREAAAGDEPVEPYAVFSSPEPDEQVPYRDVDVERVVDDVLDEAAAIPPRSVEPDTHVFTRRTPDVPADEDIPFLVEHAVFGSRDKFRPAKRTGRTTLVKDGKTAGSATRARERLRRVFGMGEVANRLKRQRIETFGDDFEVAESAAKAAKDAPVNPNDVVGFINDPRRLADAYVQSTKAFAGRAVSALPEPRMRGFETVGDEAIIRGANPAYERRLQAKFKEGKVTQKQVDTLTKRAEINIGTEAKPVLVERSYWDRLNEVLDEKRAKRKAPDWNSIQTPGDVQVAMKKWDAEFAEDLAAARVQVKDEFWRSLVDPTGKRNAFQQADRVLQGAMGIVRQNAMYNPVTGVGAGLQDFLGNLRTSFLSGEGAAVRLVPTIAKQMSKMGMDPESWMDLPALAIFRDMGVPLPPDLFKTVGREQIVRTEKLWTTRLGDAIHLPNRINFLHLISSETVKNWRQFQDSAWRVAVWGDHVMKHLPAERIKLLKAIEKKAGTREGLWRDVYNLGPAPSVDDIRRVAREYGPDDTFARTWARQLDDLSRKANAKQNKVFFSYKKLKIDEPLSRGFMFHYWMTRHSILYAQLMMQHPQLIRMEYELWKWTEDQRSDFPAPDWMKGFVGWAYGNGHNLYFDPVAVVSGVTVTVGLGDKGFNRSKLDGVINQTGLFPNPLFRIAWAAFGLTTLNDPTMTTHFRRFGLRIMESIINSEYGREHGWPQRFGAVLPDHFQDGMNWIIEHANKGLTELGIPFARELDLPDTKDTRVGKVEKILLANMMEEWGHPVDWEDWQWREYVNARDAIRSGADNPWAEAAIDEQAELEYVQLIGNALSPTSVVTQDQPSALNDQAVSTAYGKLAAGQPLTPEEQALLDATDLNRTISGEPTELSLDRREYQAIPDGLDEQHKAGWSQIAYEQFGPGMGGEIGGTFYTGEEINAMSQEERFALADQWLADQGVVPDRNYFAATTAPGRRAELREEQKAFTAANPNLDDFLSYQKYVGDAEDTPGGVRELRLRWERGNPDSAFSRAIDDRRQDLMGRGLRGEELEAGLDRWMMTEDAYLAIRGVQAKEGGATGDPLFGVDVPPWQLEEESAGGAGGNAYTTDEKKPKREQVGLAFLRERGKQAAGVGYDVRDSIYALPGSSGSTARPTRLRGQGIFDEYLRAP